MAGDERAMPRVWTVSELTAAVRRTLEGQFPVIDLEGEITGFKRYPSGHAYFTLKDSVSQISAVMFKGAFDACAAQSGFKDGAKLKVRGRVTIGTRSQYQFVVLRARLLGEGELMQRYLELKAKLAAEGLFDPARKRPLPFLPRRIGLVTSPAGAVVHDLCRVLMRRFPALEIRLYPAVVQGASAPLSVLAGLDWFNRAPDGWRADLIIFGRGGGSFEDLYGFNDERLVRAVAASRVPTISAVGHETDFTLCDFAADLRAGTPSMAAELAVPEREKLVRRIDDAQAALVATLRGKYEWYAQKVDGLAGDLPRSLAARTVEAAHRLERAGAKLAHGATARLVETAHRLERADTALAHRLTEGLTATEHRLATAATRLNLLSPYAVLERGYSLTTDEKGAVLREAAAVAPGAVVRTRLRHGTLTSVVT